MRLRRRVIQFGVAAMLVSLSFPVEAQQATKLPRIGYLLIAPLSSAEQRIEPFRQGLRDLGYVEGKNIVIEWRSSEGNPARMPTLAAELVQLKVDVIITPGSEVTRPAKAATVAIPIVMAQDDDPVANGFVASLARPGGNITGLSSQAPEISGKQLELLNEIIPNLSRVAFVGTATRATNAKSLAEIEAAARVMKVQVQYLDVLNPKDIEPAFQAAAKGRADAILWVVSGSITRPRRTQVLQLAIKSRLPLIYSSPGWVEEGGLMAYGVNVADLDRRAATYVDKILKGANPATLPIEQPTKFDLVINVKTAKQIGVTIPQNVLARADKVIK